MEQGMADLFDHIDDLLDFPSDDDQDYDGEDALVMVQQPCNNTGAFLLPPLGLPPPPPPAAPIAVDGALPGAGDGSLECSSNQKPRDELEIAELEWTTAFLDSSDPFCHDLACYDVTADTDADGDNAQSKGEIHAFFRTASPVSVLGSKPKSCSAGADSSSSSSSSTCASYLSGGENEGGVPFPPTQRTKEPLAPLIPARARSKRRRPAALLARAPVVTPSVPPSSDSIAATSDPESSGESCPPRPLPPPPPKKIKITFKKRSPVAAAAAADEEDEWGSHSPPAARKCLHCGIQKTPQWRAGPLGPKTLCNACGVRYKSGRLFPEYRPAASPTFVPTLHSNSHKKVVEMRIQTTKRAAAAPASDGCDLLEYIRRPR